MLYCVRFPYTLEGAGVSVLFMRCQSLWQPSVIMTTQKPPWYEKLGFGDLCMLPILSYLEFSDSSQSPSEESLDRRHWKCQPCLQDQLQSPTKQESPSSLTHFSPRDLWVWLLATWFYPLLFIEKALSFYLSLISPSTNVSSSLLSYETPTQVTF